MKHRPGRRRSPSCSRPDRRLARAGRGVADGDLRGGSAQPGGRADDPPARHLARSRDGWSWDFGDGASASTASPSHAWSEPGTYTVRLDAQGASAEKTITVSAETTLRLLAAHPFEISIDAKDPGDGSASPAQAIAISDRFGWFSFPGLTNDPGNPEVTVKVLEAPTFGHYWIFWSAMTSLEYTMTVRDVVTNQVQVYAKTGSDPCGGWDLQSFPFQATPTPGGAGATPTPAPPTPTHAPNRTTLADAHAQRRRRRMTADGDAAPPRRRRCRPGRRMITLRVAVLPVGLLSVVRPWTSPAVHDGHLPVRDRPRDPHGLGRTRSRCTRAARTSSACTTATRGGEDAAPQDQRAPRDRTARHDAPDGPGHAAPSRLTIPAGGLPDCDFNCTNSGCTPRSAAAIPAPSHEMIARARSTSSP